MNEENKITSNIEVAPAVPVMSDINISVADPTQTTLINQEPLPKSVIISLVIGWVLYVPPAFLFFGLSLMAGDSGSELLLLQGMSINLIPLALMATFTYIAIKRRSLSIAIATPIITLIGSVLIFQIAIGIIYSQSLKAKAKEDLIIISPEENRFVCSQKVYIEVSGEYTFLTKKENGGVSNSSIGNVEDGGRVIVHDFFARNEEGMKTLNECRNSEGKTFSEKYTVVTPVDEKKVREEQKQRGAEMKTILENKNIKPVN